MSTGDEPARSGTHFGTLTQGVALFALLGLALFVGVKLGTAQREAEEANDPVAAYEQERADLHRQLARLVPDLLGEGHLGSSTDLAAAEAELEDLARRSREDQIALDLNEARAALLRARFEASLRARDLRRAAELVTPFAGRPDGLLLEARVALARGERPPQGPLRVLTTASDPRLAEAARVVLARLMSEEEPEQALDLLREKVSPARVVRERDRVNLFLAVRKLDAQAVHELLARASDGAPRRQLALSVAHAGRRLAARRPVQAERLESALRILILLKAPVSDPEAAQSFARAVVEAAGALDPGEPQALLLEHLAEAGLRSGEFPAGAALLDGLGDAQVSETVRLRLLVALVRLEVRVQRAHLTDVDPAALSSLPRDTASQYLRYRLDLAAGSEIALKALHGLATGKVGQGLGPVHRARALLLGSRWRDDDAAALVERALALDPGSPWIRVENARHLARRGQPEKALDEAEGAHVLFDRMNKGRLGADAERLRFWHALTLVHAQRRDEALTEVFLKKLEKEGYGGLAALQQEARGVLRGE